MQDLIGIAGTGTSARSTAFPLQEIEGLFERPVMILPDQAHSTTEQRSLAIGKTEAGRYVFLIFTIRERDGKSYVRPISARYMHKKEIEAYEKENPDL